MVVSQSVIKLMLKIEVVCFAKLTLKSVNGHSFVEMLFSYTLKLKLKMSSHVDLNSS